MQPDSIKIEKLSHSHEPLLFKDFSASTGVFKLTLSPRPKVEMILLTSSTFDYLTSLLRGHVYQNKLKEDTDKNILSLKPVLTTDLFFKVYNLNPIHKKLKVEATMRANSSLGFKNPSCSKFTQCPNADYTMSA